MVLVTLNGAFGAGFLFFAMNALRRGWPFLRDGWLALQTQGSQPDARQNVERRRAISQGGRFFLGGLMWLVAAVISFAAALYFIIQAWTLMYPST